MSIKIKSMEKQYEYNGYTYWVTIEPAIHQTTGQMGFIAYVSDEKPGGLFYGTTLKDPLGRTMFFETEFAALTNANVVKQSELGRR